MCVESRVRRVRVERMLGVDFIQIECLFLGKVGGGRGCFDVKGYEHSNGHNKKSNMD